MRDLLVLGVVFAALPFIVRRPWIGVMYWVWLSLMNPHRLAWGIAYTFPLAQVVAIATLAGLVFTRDDRRFKGGAVVWTLLLFLAWTCVTTFFALAPSQATPMLERVLKIQLLTFVAIIVLCRKEHVLWMVWVIVLSLGYYTVKGGAFTIATLGEYRVWGPPESMIYDNNALALATVMTIPLWSFLFAHYRDRWWRWGLLVAIVLSAASALGSHSRGGLLAIAAMSAFLWLKGRRKIILGVVLVVIGIGLLTFMPSSWEDRMRTMLTYQEDESAMGRIETWAMLTDLALDRPIVGGGFEPYTLEVLQRYRPQYDTVRSAHSIYFQVLGEHGFVGFALFAAFWILAWFTARSIIRETSRSGDQAWANLLARMIQVSFVGYFVGGAFLNLAYWDMPYYLMVILVITLHVVRNERTSEQHATGPRLSHAAPPPAAPATAAPRFARLQR